MRCTIACMRDKFEANENHDIRKQHSRRRRSPTSGVKEERLLKAIVPLISVIGCLSVRLNIYEDTFHFIEYLI